MNTHLLPTLLALFVSGAVLAAEIKMDDQSQLTQKATKGAGERYFRRPRKRTCRATPMANWFSRGEPSLSTRRSMRPSTSATA